MTEREIVVKGCGQARSMPDRAVIGVVLDAEAATAEQAYAEASLVAQRIDEVLARRSEGIAQVLIAALTVQPRSRWKRGESVRTGWRAVRSASVEVTDFSQLGELIAELTTGGGAVSGPTWRLDESNSAHGQARRAAAEDARRRAEDYAAALGLSLGPVAWVSEPGLRGNGDAPQGFAVSAMARAVGGGPGGPDEVMEVAPSELTTEAAVEVGFRLPDEHP